MFLSLLLVAGIVVVLVWGWFYQRFHQSLDREADQRLRRIAEILSISIAEAADDEDRHARAMQSFWQLEKTGGLLQNLYLLDMSAASPVFIASYSLPGKPASPMLPPTAEEAEELALE